MKKLIGNLVRVLVSVGILIYLFNSIFHKEAAKYFSVHQIDPDALSWSERAHIVWTQGPQALWEVFHQINAAWFALAVLSVGSVCWFGVVRWQWILNVQGLKLPMKRAFSISFIIPFNLSSNSPLYFVPAINDPRSSETSSFSFKDSGTSPLAIR